MAKEIRNLAGTSRTYTNERGKENKHNHSESTAVGSVVPKYNLYTINMNREKNYYDYESFGHIV